MNEPWTIDELNQIIEEFDLRALLPLRSHMVNYFQHDVFAIVLNTEDNTGYVITKEGMPMNKEEFQRLLNMKVFW